MGGQGVFQKVPRAVPEKFPSWKFRRNLVSAPVSLRRNLYLHVSCARYAIQQSILQEVLVICNTEQE